MFMPISIPGLCRRPNPLDVHVHVPAKAHEAQVNLALLKKSTVLQAFLDQKMIPQTILEKAFSIILAFFGILVFASENSKIALN
jgi:hypothetical protein